MNKEQSKNIGEAIHSEITKVMNEEISTPNKVNKIVEYIRILNNLVVDYYENEKEKNMDKEMAQENV